MARLLNNIDWKSPPFQLRPTVMQLPVRDSADFWLPLEDLGDGSVSVKLGRGTGAATYTRATIANTRQWKPYFLSTGERVTLDLDFVTNGGSMTPRVGAQTVTFTRSGTATRVNASGLIETIAVDTPRFDYSPVSPYAIKGLLIEEARTNLCLRSQEFDHASWGGTASATANTDLAPDGTLTADTITDATAAFLNKAQSFVVADDSLLHAFSIFVKKSADQNSPVFAVNLNLTGGTPVSVNARFDVTAGTTGSVATTAYVEDYGRYWRIVVFITNNTSGNTALGVTVFPASGFHAALPTSSSDNAGAQGSAVVWGAQLEKASFPTSYIPTTSATVARGADLCTITSLAGWFNAVEGALFAEAIFGTDTVASVAYFDDGTGNERMGFLRVTATVNELGIFDGGVSQSQTSLACASATRSRMTFGYKLNDVRAAADGTLGALDGAVTLPTVTILNIGSAAGGSFLNGHVCRVLYSPQRVVDANITTLSSSTPVLANGGNLFQVASGTPRSHYSSAGAYLGYLAEGARTNLCLRSAEADNASWVKTDTTATAEAMVAPDGTVTADLLTEGTAGTASIVQSFVIADGSTHTFSQWFKKGNHQWAALIAFSGGTGTFAVYVDLTNGVLGSTVDGSTVLAQAAAATIESWGNGWYRVSLSVTITGATALSIGSFSAAADANATRVNNATHYQWGAQLEAAFFASSYIPTAGASVPRNADVLTYVFAGNASGSAGTALAELSTVFDGAAPATQIALSPSTANAFLYVASGAGVTTISNFDGTTNDTKSGLTSMGTAARKRAGSWGGAGRSITGDGAAVTTAAFDGDMGSTAIGVGCFTDGANSWFGTIKSARIWTRQMADADLLALTA